MLRRILLSTVLALALAPAATASVDTSTSANWSGYVAHRAGVRFRQVRAAWTQPTATCTAGRPAYSATWVGLGGFHQSSNSLEQIGTEVDCNDRGEVVSSAWYELVPAPPGHIRLAIKPGDAIVATVRVIGHRVTLNLTDLTRHRSFQRTVTERAVDVTSADWIVEAPSECFGGSGCRTLPLADFGSVQFTTATAQTVSGRTGSISSRMWNRSRITLTPDFRSFIAFGSEGQSTPSPLTDAGASFRVGYSAATPLPRAGVRPAAAQLGADRRVSAPEAP